MSAWSGSRRCWSCALLGIFLAAIVAADPQALFAAVAADDVSAIEKALERADINSIGYYHVGSIFAVLTRSMLSGVFSLCSLAR